MKGPIITNGEKEESGDKAEAADALLKNALLIDLEKKIAKKSKTQSPGSAPGGTLRFGVGSDTVSPPPNRPRGSLFGSRDDYGFQGNCDPSGIHYEIGNAFLNFCSSELVCPTSWVDQTRN